MPNTVALVAQTVLATVITLVQVKILANFLSRETFGLFASLRGFSLLIAMVAANGLPQLLVRWLPVQEARGDRAAAVRLATTGLALAGLFFAVLYVVVERHRTFFVGFVSNDILEEGFFVWFYITTAGVLLKQVVYGGLNGLRRLVVQVVLELVTLSAVLAWIVIDRDQLSLVRLFTILGAINGVTAGAGVIVFLGLIAATPRVSATSDTRPAPGFAEYRSYYLWAALLSVIALAFTDVDRYLVSRVLALEVVALFHIAARVTRLANRALAIPNLAFQPEITRLDTEGRSAAIAPATRIFLKFNILVSVWLTFAIGLFGRDIIVLVASADYLEATPALVILALSLPLTTMTAPFTTVMRALDQVKTALVVDLAWALTYVGLMFALGAVWGLIGVTVAQAVACALQLVLAVTLSRLAIGLSFVLRVFVRVVAIGALTFWPTALVGGILGGDVGLVHEIIAFVVGCFVFQRLVRATKVFEEDERSTLESMLPAPVSMAARWL